MACLLQCRAWVLLGIVSPHERETIPTDSASSCSIAPPMLFLSELLKTKYSSVQVFSRGQDEEHHGLTPGFLAGSAHQTVVRGRAPRHRGVLLGRVEAVRPGGRVRLALAAPVKRGDGVVFDAGRPEEDECGEHAGCRESEKGVRPDDGAVTRGHHMEGIARGRHC